MSRVIELWEIVTGKLISFFIDGHLRKNKRILSNLCQSQLIMSKYGTAYRTTYPQKKKKLYIFGFILF